MNDKEKNVTFSVFFAKSNWRKLQSNIGSTHQNRSKIDHFIILKYNATNCLILAIISKSDLQYSPF